jgi:hypothetical protein
MDIGVSTVKTFVEGVPTYRGNDWPALKKNTLIGTPNGIFDKVKEKGGVVREAVSVCPRTALLLAWRTLITVPDTVPVIATEPPTGGVDAALSPELSPLHAPRLTMKAKRRR